MTKDELEPALRRFITVTSKAYADLTPAGPWSAPAARRVAEQVREPWRQGGPVMHQTREMFAPTRHGQVRVRLHRPDADPAKPALFYLHGGGFTIFSIDTHDRVMREFAGRTGMAVIGVDYALAPEAKFPVALEQIVDVVRWTADQAQALDLDANRLAVAGDSAGGNLSFGAALSLRDAGRSNLLKAIVSIYGGFGVPASDEITTRYGDGYMLTREEAAFFWNNYLEDQAQRANPLASPIQADLRGLPPCFMAIALMDINSEQNLTMVDRLLGAGVQVTTEVYENACHSFIEAVSISAVAERAFKDMSQWLGEIFPPPHPPADP